GAGGNEGGRPGGEPTVTVRPRRRGIGEEFARAIVTVITIAAGMTLVAMLALLIVTGTDWGRERVRRAAQSALGGIVHGRVHIGRITGNLLVGTTVHDV